MHGTAKLAREEIRFSVSPSANFINLAPNRLAASDRLRFGVRRPWFHRRRSRWWLLQLAPDAGAADAERGGDFLDGRTAGAEAQQFGVTGAGVQLIMAGLPMANAGGGGGGDIVCRQVGDDRAASSLSAFDAHEGRANVLRSNCRCEQAPHRN
jgi:hypothetical protein